MTMSDYKFLTLGNQQTKLLDILDDVFKSWAIDLGASQLTPPLMLSIENLNELDVLINFPHETILSSTLNLAKYHDCANFDNRQTISHHVLNDVNFAIPKAACYSAYLFLKNYRLENQGLIITLKGQCSRNENNYDAHSRFMGFIMREIIFIGTKEFVLNKLAVVGQAIFDFAQKISLDIDEKIATDSFYTPYMSKQILQKLAATKIEYCYNDIAIASKNFHGNFFSKKCNILDYQGNYAFSGCIAFGLERWIFVLFHYYKSWEYAVESLENILKK